MSHHGHHRHGHHGQQYAGESSAYGYGAPTYNYDPLQQGSSYGQQIVPSPYGPPAPYGGGYEVAGYGQQPYYGEQGYGQQVMPYQGGYGGYPGQEMQYLQAEEHWHRQNEHRAEVGALGAVAFAAVSIQ